MNSLKNIISLLALLLLLMTSSSEALAKCNLILSFIILKFHYNYIYLTIYYLLISKYSRQQFFSERNIQ